MGTVRVASVPFDDAALGAAGAATTDRGFAMVERLLPAQDLGWLVGHGGDDPGDESFEFFRKR